MSGVTEPPIFLQQRWIETGEVQSRDVSKMKGSEQLLRMCTDKPQKPLQATGGCDGSL